MIGTLIAVMAGRVARQRQAVETDKRLNSLGVAGTPAMDMLREEDRMLRRILRRPRHTCGFCCFLFGCSR